MKSKHSKSAQDERMEDAEAFFKSVPSAVLKEEMREVIGNELWRSDR